MATLCVRGSTTLPPYKPIVALGIRKEKPFAPYAMATLCVRGSTLVPPYKPIVTLGTRKEKPLFRSLCCGHSVCEGLYSCTTIQANSSLRNQKRETFISLPMLWLLCVWGALLLLPPYKPIVALGTRKEKPLFRSLCCGHSVCEGLYSFYHHTSQ